jgi:hypothetical protein
MNLNFSCRKQLIAQTLFAAFALAMPIQLAAQHTRYKLFDVGTLGGPASSTSNGLDGILNNHGTAVGWANTSTPDPYAPFAGGRARWNGSAAYCAGRQRYIRFHSGIPARIDNLARVHSCNFRGHYFGQSPSSEWRIYRKAVRRARRVY